MYENTVKNTVIYHKRYSTIKLPRLWYNLYSFTYYSLLSHIV